MGILLDTDVMIEALRGSLPAQRFIEAHVGDAHVSAVTVAELYQGVRDGREMEVLAEALAAFKILDVSAEVAARGGLFARKWKKSHGCGLMDCLIAATADIHGLTVTTFNAKHYPMLKGVEAPYKR